jgi:hypothetical protein
LNERRLEMNKIYFTRVPRGFIPPKAVFDLIGQTKRKEPIRMEVLSRKLKYYQGV